VAEGRDSTQKAAKLRAEGKEHGAMEHEEL